MWSNLLAYTELLGWTRHRRWKWE